MKSEKLQLIFLRIALLRHLRVCSPMQHCGEGFRIFNRIKLEKVVNFIIVSKAQNDDSFMQLFCKYLFHLNSYVFQKKKLLTFQLMVKHTLFTSFFAQSVFDGLCGGVKSLS